jgi:hypothetical protein
MFLYKDYFEYLPSTRIDSNIYKETYIRAKQIYNLNPGKITLGMSSGLDSQTMLLAFIEQGLDVEYAFMHLPGYNDVEYNQLKILKNKFKFKCQIVNIDPIANKDKIINLAKELDVNPNAALHTLFLSQLDPNRLFVQHLHDHFIYCRDGHDPYFIDGYYIPGNARLRAWRSLNRPGGEISFCHSNEYLYSMISDDIYQAAIRSAPYFDSNGLSASGKTIYLNSIDRWDYYIKPIMFAKYWQDKLVYFPKFAGTENLDYLSYNPNFLRKLIAVPYFDFIKFLETGTENKKLLIDDIPEDIKARFKAFEPRLV